MIVMFNLDMNQNVYMLLTNPVFQVQTEGITNKGNDMFERFYRVSVIDSYKVDIFLHSFA